MQCPHCRESLEFSAKEAGKEGECPSCQQRFKAPRSTGTMKRIRVKAQNLIFNHRGMRLWPDWLPHPKEPKVKTLPISGYAQTQSYTCGFAAGSMVLKKFQPAASLERFYGFVKPHPTRGTSRGRLRDSLRRCGIAVNWRNDLDFSSIMAAIDRNKPIATVVHYHGENMVVVKHWVVIYGYGKSPPRIFVAGTGFPILSRKELPWNWFKKHFWRTQGFGLVCSRSHNAK